MPRYVLLLALPLYSVACPEPYSGFTAPSYSAAAMTARSSAPIPVRVAVHGSVWLLSVSTIGAVTSTFERKNNTVSAQPPSGGLFHEYLRLLPVPSPGHSPEVLNR